MNAGRVRTLAKDAVLREAREMADRVRKAVGMAVAPAVGKGDRP
jgi:hypothetical protein